MTICHIPVIAPQRLSVERPPQPTGRQPQLRMGAQQAQQSRVFSTDTLGLRQYVTKTLPQRHSGQMIVAIIVPATIKTAVRRLDIGTQGTNRIAHSSPKTGQPQPLHTGFESQPVIGAQRQPTLQRADTLPIGLSSHLLPLRIDTHSVSGRTGHPSKIR